MALFIAAIIVLLTLSIFIGHYRFYHLIEKEKNKLFNLSGNTEKKVVPEDLERLPEIMKRYMVKVGVVGRCRDCHAIIKQSGQIRQKQHGKWMNFNAHQFMTAEPLGFIWAARAFPIFVKDKSVEGRGEVNVSFLALKNVTVQRTSKTDESALARCLGELTLYPVAFLNKGIEWKVLSKNSVKAQVTVGSTSSEGIFHFDENGLIHSFESKRYRGDVLEDFIGKVENYQMKSDILIPTKMKAIWQLKEGDFEYFNCEIVDYRIV